MVMKLIKQYLVMMNVSLRSNVLKIFEGINIPIHGYADLKGKIIIEDKCKFPRKGRVKKDGTRSWATNKLPENGVDAMHLTQIDFYYYATGLPIYVCYINEKEFKVYHKDNCEDLQPEKIMSRLESFKTKMFGKAEFT
jgi:hypothetical protein